jgi:hypothetical protein
MSKPKMTNADTDLAALTEHDLAQREAAAAAELAALRAERLRLVDERRERQTAAQAEHDRAVVDGWHKGDRQALDADVQAAGAAFRAAVKADPVWSAWRALLVAQGRGRARFYEFGSAVQRLTGERPDTVNAPRVGEFSLIDNVVRLIEDDAAREVQAEMDARDLRRMEAGLSDGGGSRWRQPHRPRPRSSTRRSACPGPGRSSRAWSASPTTAPTSGATGRARRS